MSVSQSAWAPVPAPPPSFIFTRKTPTPDRNQVRDIAAPFVVEDVAAVNAELFHLGPLNRNDIPVHLVEHLSARATVSVDVQGYLREVSGDESGWRTLRHGPWEGQAHWVPTAGVCRTDRQATGRDRTRGLSAPAGF